VVRTHDDSWDITEGVGTTALAMAAARATETNSEHPLFVDPYAQLFLDAARESGWEPFAERNRDAVTSDPQVNARMTTMSGYTASRTRYFDEFFLAAGREGITQAVILAAGLDSRAWRITWPPRSIVYEIDQPKVLQFKTAVLEKHHAEPACKYVPVGLDLRQDWPKALRGAGFDPAAPAAFSAEGLLPYLPSDAQDLLFERIAALSAPGSRIAVEEFTPAFFESFDQMRRQAQAQQTGGAAATEELFFFDDRAGVADWLSDRGWAPNSISSHELMSRYDRAAPPGVEHSGLTTTNFIEAQLP
jgi:methyltransferase (TIGR00027 family)